MTSAIQNCMVKSTDIINICLFEKWERQLQKNLRRKEKTKNTSKFPKTVFFLCYNQMCLHISTMIRQAARLKNNKAPRFEWEWVATGGSVSPPQLGTFAK